MKNIRYYSFNDNEKNELNLCSIESSARPLVVNCGGVISLDSEFVTDNAQGRLDYYFMYISEGELEVELEDGVSVARQGDVIVFPPKTRYRYRHKGGDRIVYFWAHFSGSHAERYLRDYGFDKLPCICRTDASSEISRKFEKLFDIYSSGGRFRDHKLGNCFDDILICAASRMVNSGELSEGRFSRSIKYINSFYSSDISVKELAVMENLSVSRYNCLFREVVGISPEKYLINLRIDTACSLLRETDMSIKQISVLVGYRDSCYFSRLFKKHKSLSPMQYRKA